MHRVSTVVLRFVTDSCAKTYRAAVATASAYRFGRYTERKQSNYVAPLEVYNPN